MTGMPQRTTQQTNPLKEWEKRSIICCGWCLQNEQDLCCIPMNPDDFHEDIRPLARHISTWNRTESLWDYIVDQDISWSNKLPDIAEKCPITKSGPDTYRAMLKAHAEAELERAIGTKDRAAIEKAFESLRAAQENTTDPWLIARKTFPRVPVPWEYLDISESIKQLARAGAVTPTPLPGAVFAILAGIIGRSADISPKRGWREPFIFWHADIRESGAGKTHSPRTLISSLYDWQKDEDERYRRDQEAYETLDRKSKQDMATPSPARSYFGTDITLEGLRTALDGHPTGGMTVLLDELSSFFSGQNQYKNGKGSDREAWLCLHDGHHARVIRAGKSCYIYGGRVQLYGGVQPAVLRQAVTSKNGIYLDDGTVFRFFFTFSKSSFHELTGETWSDTHKQQWISILSRVHRWSNEHSKDHWHMALDQESRKYFFDWRNDLYGLQKSLPRELRGFIPKAVGYVLRLAGVIHCLNRFAQGKEPLASLKRKDLDAGIAFVRFYLGQTVDAIYYLVGEGQGKPAIDMTDSRVIILGRALDKIEQDVVAGMVSVGHVHKAFNELVPESEQLKSSRSMGAFLRSLGLTIPARRFNWGKSRGVFCLKWDEKIKIFRKQCPPPPQCPPTHIAQGLADNA